MLSMLHPAEDRWILKMFVWDQRIVGPIRLVAGCRKRWLNQAVSLSVLYLVLGFFWVCFFLPRPVWLCSFMFSRVLSVGCSAWLSSMPAYLSDWLERLGSGVTRNVLTRTLNPTLSLCSQERHKTTDPPTFVVCGRSQLRDRQRAGGEQADHILQRRLLWAERLRAGRRHAEALHVWLPLRPAHLVLLDTAHQERAGRLRRTAGRGAVLQKRR